MMSDSVKTSPVDQVTHYYDTPPRLAKNKWPLLTGDPATVIIFSRELYHEELHLRLTSKLLFCLLWRTKDYFPINLIMLIFVIFICSCALMY